MFFFIVYLYIRKIIKKLSFYLHHTGVKNLVQQNYTGWKVWHPTSDEWITLYTENKVPFELKENEYLIVKTADNVTTYYCYEKGTLRKVSGSSIKTTVDLTPINLEEELTNKEIKQPKKKFSKGKSICITPRNDEQVCAFDLIKDPTKTIKLLTGTWGTGKTLILVTAALEALKNNRFDKIIWIRNNVDLKDTKDLGALPGDVLTKLLPFLGPFRDHAGDNAVKTMLNKGTLVVEPLQSLRGRNFENSLIMCSECENLTKEQIQLIIARAAEGTEVWLDGDTRQRDKATFEKSRGVESLIEKFAGQELFGYVNLVKSERSRTAAMADLLN